ncbi:MAG: hypothetical protein QXW52_08635 [Candidatus Caldarchaeum sp.]
MRAKITIISLASIAVIIALYAAFSPTIQHQVVGVQDAAGARDSFGPRVNVEVYKNGELVAKAHNIITDAGMGFLRNAVHLGTAGSDVAKFIALSTDSTAPAYTATTCPSEITSGGLARAAGTVSTQSGPANGDITVRVENTFTATGSHTGVQKACLFTASSAGTLYAMATFSPVNLAANDQLTIRWDFTYQN